MANKKIKVAGYAQRIFFNDNIEYRDFSPDLVGFQLTSDGGTTLFTNGNFSISVNLDPKPDVLFKQGTKSRFYTLDDIAASGTTQLDIQKNVKTKLNLDLSNPLSYVWYGSAKELIRASLLDIQEKWPAAIYVDTKVGSVTGNNITDYVYDIEADESTFSVNSNFFVNPYAIKYTLDAQYISDTDITNPLRNFTVNYGSYVIEHNGIIKKIKSITPSPQKTNSVLELIVEGNPFPELTGIFIPQLSFLFNNVTASIPYFIKPNESENQKFFTSLNDFQSNILNKNLYPKYKSEIISTNYTDDGVLLTSKSVLTFPILEDGYNLNFFDSFYIAYIDELNKLGEGLDGTKTDTIVRKYTTEAISSFDTIPRADGADIVLNGEKATKLLRIYGVEFDYVKKYINAIKFAHVVTYDKKNNVPDTLVKDLAYMLGIEPINFIDDASFSKLFLPSNGSGSFSGTSTNLTQSEIDIELYRRLILNIAWLWKSKGTRKAVEFLFRFIGAPESLVNFNEYIVILDKPLDIEEIKKLLYLYTGEVNLEGIPYDDEGFPLPPVNGDVVITNFIDPQTGELVENDFTEMYFQKAGGWYRETYGSNVVSVLRGNNPHVGKYDGGNEYLQYFSRCYIPNFDNQPTVTLTATTIVENYFINYNYGIFNGISNNSDIFTTQLTFNPTTNGYQPIEDCIDVDYSIIETPLQNDGKTTLQQAFNEAEANYNQYLLLIEKDGYLIYSPEWQTIKNNYELSLKNCLNEISTENCDINKTLEICLSEKPKNVVEYSCDNLNLEDCSPFIYYTNSDGIKVSFDEFPACCKTQDANYISYVNEYGRQTEYCSKLAPCVGTPSGTLPNGVIEFTMTNNTTPQLGTYQIGGKCYQYSNTQISLSDFIIKYGEPKTFINNYCGKKRLSDTFKKDSPIISCNKFFTEVNCKKTSIISSPECCAWYGYDYQILEQNGNKFIVCKKNNENSATELTTPDANYTLPIIDFSVNNSYYDLQNPIGSIYEYYSTEIFWDCFNESRIVKGVVEGSTSLSPQPNSILEDPSLMNPSNWKVESIDEYGRVSFTPSIYNNNFILDWYSTDLLSDLYGDVANYYGYQFGQFTFDYDNNILIPYNGDNQYSTNPNSIIIAAVDPSRIGCGDFNSVAVVFASEKWKGFKLPQLDDCSCTIDFSFDYMLKYTADNLIKCADNISCFPAFIYDNTINNIKCLNFVAFTNSDEESQNLQSNFNDSENLTDEYVIWQNSNILEPNTDCCRAVDGNVVSFTQWSGTNQSWVNNITQTYNDILSQNSQTLSSLNFDYTPILGEIKKYDEIKNKLLTIVSNLPTSCFVFNFNVGACEIKYEKYITTQNVCSLQIPLECGLWSKLYGDYEQLSSEISELIELINRNLEPCLKNSQVNVTTDVISNPKLPADVISNPKLPADVITPKLPTDTFKRYATKPQLEIIEDIKVYNSLTTQKNVQLDNYTINETILKNSILEINNEIAEKQESNVIIEKALTNVNTNLDCSVYENTIKELKNFDYVSYCNTIIYGDSINDGTKTKEYSNCVSSKTKENQDQIIVYSQLFESCVLKTQLTDQLVKAKFDNNTVLITELEKQIQDLSNTINTLTTDVNNFISYDESAQKSQLLQNDTQNTINKTADILSVSTKSITDNSGNLQLTDSQKVKLNVELTKNQSQISGLITEREQKTDLFTQNLKNQTFVKVGTEFKQNAFRTVELSPLMSKPVVGISTNVILDLPKLPADNLQSADAITNPKLPTDAISVNSKECLGITSNSLTITPNYVVLTNGKNIPQNCCNKATLNLDVSYVNKECILNPRVIGSESSTTTTYDVQCCPFIIELNRSGKIKELNQLLDSIQNSLLYVEEQTYICYNKWYESLIKKYNVYEESNNNNYLNYIDDLKINFKLFVDNNNIDVQNNIDTSLTYLPYTQSVNPIWEFNPNEGYSGIFIEGDEQLMAQIEESIFNQLSSQGISYNSDLFEPDWKTFNFTIPECVCDDLRRLYPNKDFFFSIEIQNYECNLCLLVDNIMVNVSDCKTNRILSINDCLIPQLNCVIDNKKSWVYYDGGVVKETIYPNGECNTGSTNNYEIVRITNPEERLWLDLEYRYTNYDVYHSDLILNVKNTSFSIDPAKSIECDVFNFWKRIDCDNCPTDCNTDNYIFQSDEDYLFMGSEEYIFQDQIATYINFNGVLNINNTLTNYTIDLGASTSSVIPFSCETFTNILQNQVIELKNEYYTLTANYSESLNSNYYDLLNKGESLSKFYIDGTSCDSDILVLNNNKNLDNLFSLIVEDSDGTINLFEIYVYSGTPLYNGGVEQQIGAGITAQTFNQSSEITKECCLSINKLLNDNGVDGLGLGKNYRWNELNEVCYWRDIDECANCKGDCEYCGKMKECVSGVTTNNTYSVCINPLDFLDYDPSTIMVKDVFDQMVLSNLIDAKSRQTISDYPLLRLFYELYLRASNCGKDLSGKFTYDTMFDFMDKVGDYWLDLLEQVVPATTIWEGCDNSGKIYRNTIFDQNKFKYKKYSLNFIDTELDCPLSAQTNFIVGQESIHSLVEQKPIYPTNEEIKSIKNDIRNKEIEIAIVNQQIVLYNGRLCSLNLQDTTTPNLTQSILEVTQTITELNDSLTQLNTQLSTLFEQLSQLEIEYINQQNNFYNNFMSCSGITQSLITAQNNLSNFIPGTTSYERQRNYIAGLRNKYDKCVRKTNTLISDYNTVFITQIYDTNEYEGNVTIIGDPDFDPPEFIKTFPPIQISGFYYNQELIHNCE
jgi:hypothetical protein